MDFYDKVKEYNDVYLKYDLSILNEYNYNLNDVLRMKQNILSKEGEDLESYLNELDAMLGYTYTDYSIQKLIQEEYPNENMEDTLLYLYYNDIIQVNETNRRERILDTINIRLRKEFFKNLINELQEEYKNYYDYNVLYNNKFVLRYEPTEFTKTKSIETIYDYLYSKRNNKRFIGDKRIIKLLDRDFELNLNNIRSFLYDEIICDDDNLNYLNNLYEYTEGEGLNLYSLDDSSIIDILINDICFSGEFENLTIVSLTLSFLEELGL